MTGSVRAEAAHRAPRLRVGSPADVLIVAGLGAAIGYAALQQGGFYRLAADRPSSRSSRSPRSVGRCARDARYRLRSPPPRRHSSLFAGWAGAARGRSWAAAAPPAAMALLAATGLVCATGAAPIAVDRRCSAVVLAVAVVVAASCWVGIAFHVCRRWR